MLPAGENARGEQKLRELKQAHPEAYELLDAVPRESLAPCFLPSGVYARGVHNSNWVEIKQEVLRRGGVRHAEEPLTALMQCLVLDSSTHAELLALAGQRKEGNTKAAQCDLTTARETLMDRGCQVKQLANTDGTMNFCVKTPVRLSELLISHFICFLSVHGEATHMCMPIRCYPFPRRGCPRVQALPPAVIFPRCSSRAAQRLCGKTRPSGR